jgi:hypothetical protein
MEKGTQKQYSELIKDQSNLESERLSKKYTIIQEESLLESYKSKLQTIKNTMEQKKSYYDSLVSKSATTTDEVATQKNAEKDYNNSVIENNNAISQYSVQNIKIAKLEDELSTLQSKFSSNAKFIKDNINVKDAFSINNNTLTYGAHRQVEGCSKAVIGWEPYGARLLADTLDYFRHNCNVPSSDPTLEPLTKVTIYQKPTIFTDCGKACQFAKWLKDAKENSKELKINLHKPWQVNGTK